MVDDSDSGHTADTPRTAGMPVRFRCGHGAIEAEARITLSRDCPLCMLIGETKRSRRELLAKVAPPGRAALERETRVGADYDWVCPRGHDRYPATVMDVLTGTGCPKCRASAEAPARRSQGGLPFMKPGLRLGTSVTEQRLRALLGERLRLPHRVNAIRINRTFFGRTEVWPDIIIPALLVAIEYDDPGRDGTSHRGLKEASDRDKDAALNEVGWEVIRVRAGGLDALGPNSIVCAGLTLAVIDRIMSMLRQLRGDAAVDRILAESAPDT